jgi:hypothetical protein
MMPVEVDDAEIAFPASVTHLMPPNIAEIYRNRAYPPEMEKIFALWFFKGVSIVEAVPKPGVDKLRALRHIRCIMGSHQPKHEHKTAAVAYLLGEWFEKFEVQELRPGCAQAPIPKQKPKSKKRSKR